MEKLSKILIILVTVLFISGCGSKEYTCTKVDNSNNMETTTKMVIKKDGIESSVIVVAHAKTEEQAKIVEKTLNDSKLYSSVKRDKTTITAEYTKFFEGKTSDKDVKELESDGYTCK